MPQDHYASIDDVNALIPQAPFSATSKPTQTAVTAFLEDVANDMDAMLANVGYTVPVVTGPKGLKWLRKTCALGTLAIAQAARDTGVTTAVNASGREGKNIWQQLFDERMKALIDPQNPTELPDAPRTSDQLLKQPESVLRSMVDGITDVDFSESPEIQRDQVL